MLKESFSRNFVEKNDSGTGKVEPVPKIDNDDETQTDTEDALNRFLGKHEEAKENKEEKEKNGK